MCSFFESASSTWKAAAQFSLFWCLVAATQLQAALAKEVYMLTRLNHPNLVRFCAVCLERPLVVMVRICVFRWQLMRAAAFSHTQGLCGNICFAGQLM